MNNSKLTDHPHGDDLAPAIRAKARAEAFREAENLRFPVPAYLTDAEAAVWMDAISQYRSAIRRSLMYA